MGTEAADVANVYRNPSLDVSVGSHSKVACFAQPGNQLRSVGRGEGHRLSHEIWILPKLGSGATKFTGNICMQSCEQAYTIRWTSSSSTKWGCFEHQLAYLYFAMMSVVCLSSLNGVSCRSSGKIFPQRGSRRNSTFFTPSKSTEIVCGRCKKGSLAVSFHLPRDNKKDWLTATPDSAISPSLAIKKKRSKAPPRTIICGHFD
jgi:hypothetical protein